MTSRLRVYCTVGAEQSDFEPLEFEFEFDSRSKGVAAN